MSKVTQFMLARTKMIYGYPDIKKVSSVCGRILENLPALVHEQIPEFLFVRNNTLNTDVYQSVKHLVDDRLTFDDRLIH